MQVLLYRSAAGVPWPNISCVFFTGINDRSAMRTRTCAMLRILSRQFKRVPTIYAMNKEVDKSTGTVIWGFINCLT